MKKILIVEDKPEERESLKLLIERMCVGVKVYTAAEEEKAYSIAMKYSINLFLVDVILHPCSDGGDQSGAVFAQTIRSVKKYWFTPIIFVTGLYDPKMNLLSSVQCFSIIEKPYDAKKLENTVQCALKYRTDDIQEKMYFYQSDGMLEAIPVKDIIFAKILDNQLNVTTVNGKFIIPNKTCRTLLKEIDSESFVMCRKGTVVNINYIKRIDPVNRYIHLNNCDNVLEIGPVVKKEFMEKIKDMYYVWE